MIRLLVGLGNPGPQYEATRHNAGFWFVDEVARKYGKPLTPERGYSGLAARVDGPFGALWLLEPMTFMNLSGKSVAALARFFKIAPEEVLVAHDELDLLPGQVRLKQGGSHAGHNGLRDIVAQLGSANFHRVRLGIGHPGVKAEVVDYVLRKPKPEERDAIQDAIGETLASLDLILAGEMERAMMKVHARPVPTGKALRTRPAGIASASVDPTPTAMSFGRVASEASSQDAGRHGARRSSSQSSGSTPSASPTPGLTSSGPSASAPSLSLSSSTPASSDPISSRPMSSPTIPPSPTLSSDASAGAPPSQGNVVEGTS